MIFKNRCVKSFIYIKGIELGDRKRKIYNDIEELADSIVQTKGLINPITVKSTSDENIFVLLAGGRRLKAHEYLNETEIEANIWPSDITDLELKQVELLENIQRSNLSWEEEVELEREIYELKNPDGSIKTIAETAKTIGKSTSTIQRDLALEKALNVIPALRKCKTKNDAIKSLNKYKEQAILQQLADNNRNRVAVTDSDKIKQSLIDSYIVGDFFKFASKIPSNSVDFIDLDPPYGIDYNNLVKGRDDSIQEDVDQFKSFDEKEYPIFLEQVLTECSRILRSDGWLLLWCSVWLQQINYDISTRYFKKVNRSPLLWINKGIGRTRQPSTTFKTDFQMAYYMQHGDAHLNRQAPSSIFEFPKAQNAIHPTEKPIDLMKSMMDKFIEPGCRILVPFLGGGNTLIAGHEIGMQGFGYDLSDVYRNAFVNKVEDIDFEGVE